MPHKRRSGFNAPIWWVKPTEWNRQGARFRGEQRIFSTPKGDLGGLSVDLVTIVEFIVVGGIAGFLASKVMTGHGMGLIWDIVVGIVGAFVGGWLAAALFHIAVSNVLVLLVVAFIGALILLFVFRMIVGSRGRVRA
jgi:uncharacterized membrane protein YeaQ/YmgE (transglycosylase-associated protein family)